MRLLLSSFKNKKVLVWSGIALALVLLIAGVSLARGGNGNQETIIVTRRTVVEEVRVSGTVEAKIVSDLGFETGGKITSVAVGVNDVVSRGAVLARLGLGTFPAELQSAKAALTIARSKASNTALNLDTIRQQHNTLVRNAEIELLSEGLVAEPQSPTYTQAAPVVSGRYTGREGRYKFIVRSRGQNDTDLYVFDMEDTEPVEVNDTGPTPLGSRGLFLTFPDDPEDYDDTTWYVDVPNTKSATYVQNYAAYQEAVRERDRAIEEAQRDIRQQSAGASIAQAEVAQAQAEVARIEALMGERTLRAPFSGTVTAVDIDPGESVTAGTPVISLISNDGFGVEVDIPEIDSIKIKNGNTAIITLDAFPDESLGGSVASINRTETIVDGVSVYEARIAFDEQDERIASGMTADVAITTGQKENVIAIPARAIRYRQDGETYVAVHDPDEDEREVEVVIGLRGSDGFTEIVAGLSEGDSVVIPAAEN